MNHEVFLWIGFTVVVLALLAVDLLVFNKKSHEVSIREALAWSAVWVGVALLFSVWVFFEEGQDRAFEFLTAYLIEKSLSVDNLFVFLMIFAFFKVDPKYEHKVLTWGILGAVAMRAVLIFGGVALLHSLHWLVYVFGAFLILTALKMAFQKDEKINPEKNLLLRGLRKVMPMTTEYQEDKFFVRKAGRLFATPLLAVVMVVETTDLLFAVDSIPAVLAISDDAFIVYTSNIFAILGLRALFFAVAGLMKAFRFLRQGLVIILMFVGVKMMIVDIYKLPTWAALSGVGGVLMLSILLSIVFPARESAAKEA